MNIELCDTAVRELKIARRITNLLAENPNTRFRSRLETRRSNAHNWLVGYISHQIDTAEEKQ